MKAKLFSITVFAFMLISESTTAQYIGISKDPAPGNIYHTGSNIGIGTTNPQSLLHLYDNKTLGIRFEYEKDPGELRSWDITHSGALLFTYNDGASPAETISFNTAGKITATSFIGDGSQLTNLPALWQNGVNDIYYDEGNVGIGTADPESLLHLQGIGDLGIRINRIDDITPKGDQTNEKVWDITNSGTLDFSYSDIQIQSVIQFYANGNISANKFIGDGSGLTNISGAWSTTGDNIYYNNGNVGIGTANPIGRLHIKSVNAHYNGTPTLLVQDDGNRGTLVLESLDDNPTDFVFKSNGANRVWLSSRNDADDNDFRIYTSPNGSPISRMTIEQNGYVGIGTTNPVERFQIGNKWTFHDGGVKIIGYNYDYVGVGDSRCIENGNVSYMSFEEAGITFRFVEGAVTGTPFTQTISTKIDIDGIETTEIEVKPEVWADFVFDEDYDLPSLTVVESFIQTHKHLPEIPSEKEVIENGLKLGEMNALLLQKIEELTLYTIEQQRMIEEHTLNTIEQQKMIEELKNRINEIEKK